MPNVTVDKDPGFQSAIAALQRPDLASCQPSRCDTNFDFDCTGHAVSCFIDEDCDGYAANDPDPSQRDCDDHDPRVHPGAKKDCNPDPGDVDKDWACDHNPQGGCVPCDLDGDGFQRIESDGSCPTKVYVLKHGAGKDIDCDDTDSGVFPGSSAFQSPNQIFTDLNAMSRAGSVVAALRGLCSSTEIDGTTPLNTNCDNVNLDPTLPRHTCPSDACDKDHDGFPNSGAGCNPQNLPVDCDDNDPHTFPGAPQYCKDGKDHDCDGTIDICAPGADADGDGYANRYDCNDNDPTIHPFAPEQCNGVDDNCDGIIDEHNPGDGGKRMIESFQGQNVIKSCADSTLGDCGLAKKRDPNTHQLVGQPTGQYSGRCVCSSLVPSSMQNADAAKRADCAAPSMLATAARCFGAIQPGVQSCTTVANDADEDCDGFTDDPTGANPMQEKGNACGLTRANSPCKAGTVLGCLRDTKRAGFKTPAYVNPFSSDARPASAFGRPAIDDKGVAFDEHGKYLVCTGATGPSAELCNGIDDDCDGYLYGAGPGDVVSSSGTMNVGGQIVPSGLAEVDRDGDGYLACQCDKGINLTLQSPPNFTLGKLVTDCVNVAGSNCTTLNLLGCNDCNDADGTVYPSVFGRTAARDLCDNQSNACLVTYTDGSGDCTGQSCCSSQKACRNLTNDTNNCGTCGKVCDVNAANLCMASGCVCGNTMSACSQTSTARYCLSQGGGASCVQCRSTTDCASYPGLATQKCNTVDNVGGTQNMCVACNVDNDCSTQPRCQTHYCVPCTKATEASDCKTAGALHCLELPGTPPGNKCAACNANTQCDPTTTNIRNADQCDLSVGTCSKCEGNAACANATPVCKSGTGCVECLVRSDCKDPKKPACDATNKCVPCTVNTQAMDCTIGSADFCLVNADPTKNACSQCNANAQCTVAITGNRAVDQCDTNSGTCTLCEGNAACANATPVCKPGTGCVECLVSTDCKNAAKPACDPVKNVCVPCLATSQDSDCKAKDSTKPYCLVNADATKNVCAACSANDNTDQCDPTKTLLRNADQCDLSKGTCTKCEDGAACANATPVCKVGTGCVQCLVKGDCGANQECDTTTNKCVACVTPAPNPDPDCKAVNAAKPYCVVNADSSKNFCGACDANVQCAGTANTAVDQCDLSAGTCSLCEGNAACAMATPLCKTGVGCVACFVDTDCKAGNYCDGNNTCQACTTAAHCGTKTCNVCTASAEPTCAAQSCTCAGDADCDTGDKCSATSACVHACTATADCAKADQGKVCAAGFCGCGGNADCPTQNPTCTNNVCGCGGTLCKAGQACKSGVCT